MKRLALGLGSLVLVLALLVGIPAALLFLAGNPFPSGDELSRALSTPDYGGEFLVGTLLPLIAWVAWATFALGFLVELPGHIRGIPSPHLPGLGLQQLWAAALIGAIVVMLTGVGALAGSTAGSPTAAPASVSVSQSGTGATFGSTQADGGTGTGSTDSAAVNVDTAAEAAPAAPVAAAPTYMVQPGDSLWRIAEQQLGSGERFAEIAALNLGVAQGDGHSLTAENWLNAGWVLTLPADAAVPASPDAATPAEHVVVEGDTLWDLAADAYGDGTRYPEIFAASAAVVQPDGATITDANLIQPGERVNLPGMGAPATDAAAAVAETAAPASPVVEAASPTVTPAVAAPVDASAGVEAGAAGATAFSHTAPVRTTGGIGAVLAVGLLGLLALRRTGQRGRREFGRRIALPTAEASTLELELRAVENRVGLDDIDHALRYLAVWAEDTGRTLPSIEAIRLADTDITLYLSGTDPLPRPFRTEAAPDGAATGNGTAAWTIGRAALPGVERLPQPPYPAFVTLGHDQAGAHILVDLERLGTLSVTGPPELRLGVLAAIAAELATSRRSEIRVTVVGAADDLAAALASPRLRHAPDLATLLARPAENTVTADTPEIVILASTQPLSDRQRAALAARSARLGIVQSGSTVRAAAPAGIDRAHWMLNVDDIGAARLLPLGIDLAPQLLGAAECTRLIDLFRSTAGDSVAAPEWARRMEVGGLRETGSAEGTEAASLGASGAPWIRLLGPVELIGARGVEPRGIVGGADRSRLPWATELVAFFTVHRTASAVDVQTALWPADLPTGLAAQQNRNALTNETRAWLGEGADDEPYLPVVGADGLRLHAEVRSDWDLWRQLLGDDVTLTTTATLVSALRLVTGAPLSGLPANHFAWAEPLREEITGAVLDAAHELASRARISGDADAAALAAAVRTLVDPAASAEPVPLVEPVETR